ncbi:hypothetical protein ACK1U3_17070 [Pseudomonas promysalinigenes]|uniref:hypothetical protein n=1 Tax=Pseudomonas promysalinigenes TaxID=485898 RepID=UPI0039172338
MSETLSEEDMRQALFGGAAQPRCDSGVSQLHTKPTLSPAPRSSSRSLSSRLRVTMRVAKVYEGPEELLIHDANTLSTLMAEAEAKAVAKKKKFRYFDVVSVVPV